MSKDHHSQLLSQDESHEIQHRVEELSLQADKLRDINKSTNKTRSRQLDTVKEDLPYEDHTSSEGEEETGSRLGSIDTQPYSEQPRSSPSAPYKFGKSPRLDDQPTPFMFNPQLVNNPSFPFNPQLVNNPPPTPPNVPAAPVDSMALIQAMFAQQAEANRQQAESNRHLQLLLASSLDKQIDQQAKQLQQQTNIFAQQNLADARTSIKNMRDGTDICQYLDHFENELRDAKVPHGNQF